MKYSGKSHLVNIKKSLFLDPPFLTFKNAVAVVRRRLYHKLTLKKRFKPPYAVLLTIHVDQCCTPNVFGPVNFVHELHSFERWFCLGLPLLPLIKEGALKYTLVMTTTLNNTQGHFSGSAGDHKDNINPQRNYTNYGFNACLMSRTMALDVPIQLMVHFLPNNDNWKSDHFPRLMILLCVIV